MCACICGCVRTPVTCLGCACPLLLCSACRARRSHRAPARAEDNTLCALPRWRSARGVCRACSVAADENDVAIVRLGLDSGEQLQLDAARGCAYVALPATARMTQCVAQLNLRGWRARGECHLAWRLDAKHGHGFVTIFGYQNELQHDAARCCAYAQLQATARALWRAVQLDRRGQRARCEFQLA